MHYIYLEAGSGADKPVPVEMVAAVKKRRKRNKDNSGRRYQRWADARNGKSCADMICTVQ